MTKKTCFLRNFTKLTVFSMGTRLFVDFVKIEQNHPNFTKFRVPGGGPLSPLTGLGRYTPQPPPGLTDMTPVSEWSIGVATPPRRDPPPPRIWPPRAQRVRRLILATSPEPPLRHPPPPSAPPFLRFLRSKNNFWKNSDFKNAFPRICYSCVEWCGYVNID